MASCLLFLILFLGSLTLGKPAAMSWAAPRRGPCGRAFCQSSLKEVESGFPSLSGLQMTTAWADIWKTLNQNHSTAPRFSEIRNSWYSSMTHRNCEIMCVALSCQFWGWFVNIQLQIVYNVNTFSLCCQKVTSSEKLSLMVLSKGGPPLRGIHFPLNLL